MSEKWRYGEISLSSMRTCRMSLYGIAGLSSCELDCVPQCPNLADENLHHVSRFQELLRLHAKSNAYRLIRRAYRKPVKAANLQGFQSL